MPLCEKLGRLAQGLGDGSVDRVTAEFRGRIASHDTRLLGIAVLVGILSGHTEEPVNLVNAPQMAEERGIELVETKDTGAEDFTELVTVRIGVRRATRSRSPAPASAPATSPTWSRVWGESFYLPFADHLAVFRYADRPGMIGRVGTMFGEEGVNIVSAAVGAEAGRRARGDGADHRRPGARARRSTRSSSSTASRSAARSTSSRPDRVARMQAVVLTGTGGRRSSRCEERPDPPVGPGEVRIAVRAAGINFADTMARVGLYPDAPKTPCVLGYEVAGEVESVGEGVTDHKVGDRVVAGTRFGGQAELVTVPAGAGAAAARIGSASSRAPPSRSTTAPPTRRWS